MVGVFGFLDTGIGSVGNIEISGVYELLPPHPPPAPALIGIFLFTITRRLLVEFVEIFSSDVADISVPIILLIGPVARESNTIVSVNPGGNTGIVNVMRLRISSTNIVPVLINVPV